MKATRSVISGQIGILATAFPSMLSDERQEMIEAVKRIKHTRRTTTFPPFAELRELLLASKADRLKFEHERKVELERQANRPRKLTPAEQEIAHAIHTLGRKHGVYWCDLERRFLEPSERHDCYQHERNDSIPSLTHCRDMLKRAEAEGWKREDSKFGSIGKPIEQVLSYGEELAAMGVEEPF